MRDKAQLLDLVRRATRERSLSHKTENAYLNHIGCFLEFTGKRDLAMVGTDEILAFLKHLSDHRQAAVSTQNQALSALQFFYREVLGREIGTHIKQIKRTRLNGKLPAILTAEEVKVVLSNLRGAPFLVAALMYGSGLRLAEALRLRVGDINYKRREIIVRDQRTGEKERVTVLPNSIVAALRKHLVRVMFLYEDDCMSGFGKVSLPPAVCRKYPNAESDWNWQYVFPAAKLSQEKSGGRVFRHHLAESTVQKAVAEAIEKAKIIKQGCSCYTLRHSFAVRLFEKNLDVYTIRKLLGHKNIKTTMTYFNYVGNTRNFVQSPLDC